MTKASYPLFQSHLDVAHSYWNTLVKKGDVVIDATCGNGQDTLILAQLSLTPTQGYLYGIDIQQRAVEITHQYLNQHLPAAFLARISLINQCHSDFPQEISPESVRLITYNLGYLPGGGNKNLTTRVETTLESLKKALFLIQKGGALSITLYPGHPEGQREEEKILLWAKELSPFQWNCCHHQWINRFKSPSLLLIQRNL